MRACLNQLYSFTTPHSYYIPALQTLLWYSSLQIRRLWLLTMTVGRWSMFPTLEMMIPSCHLMKPRRPFMTWWLGGWTRNSMLMLKLTCHKLPLMLWRKESPCYFIKFMHEGSRGFDKETNWWYPCRWYGVLELGSSFHVEIVNLFQQSQKDMPLSPILPCYHGCIGWDQWPGRVSLS